MTIWDQPCASVAKDSASENLENRNPFSSPGRRDGDLSIVRGASEARGCSPLQGLCTNSDYLGLAMHDRVNEIASENLEM